MGEVYRAKEIMVATYTTKVIRFSPEQAAGEVVAYRIYG